MDALLISLPIQCWLLKMLNLTWIWQ